MSLTSLVYRFLQIGNILAARTFLSHLVTQFAATRPGFVTPLQPSPIAVGKTDSGAVDEITLTTDPLVNFAQLAVRTCQRAQGDKNKTMREAWIRLCGTYQSKGGLLATKEVRKVCLRSDYPHTAQCARRVDDNCYRVAEGLCVAPARIRSLAACTPSFFGH